MEESENKETVKKEKSLNVPVIVGLIVVAIIAVIALIPVYYRYNFDSVINKGDYAEINKLINEQDFIEYATKEQGQQALEFVATNIASSSLNEKYDLMEKTAFKKFENEVVGKLIVASMTEFITTAPIEERLKFLKNHNVLFYLNDNQRKAIISSFVDYPITDIDSYSLNKIFLEICNENEVEIICNRIQQNNINLNKNFVESVLKIIIDNNYRKKTDCLKELLKNSNLAKGYLQLYAYEIGKKYINNNEDFINETENILNSFPWCFNSEQQNILDSMKKGIKTLSDAEKTVNKERVDNELSRLKEEKAKLPKIIYITNDIQELLFEGNEKFPLNFYLIGNWTGDYGFLMTGKKFYTRGRFEMYVVSNEMKHGFGDSQEIERLAKYYGIRHVYIEVSAEEYLKNNRERERLTKEINDIERNSEEVYRKITELKNKLEECKYGILVLLKREIIINLADVVKKDIDSFVESIDFEMIKCPAGSFIMGSPENELGRDGREIQHKVTISQPFYIGKYEVTQIEYYAIMGNNTFDEKKFNNMPINSVGWYEAKLFCDVLNEIYKDKLPLGYRFDLPTEAQWEYACRAGTTTALNNGKNLTTIVDKKICPNFDEIGWYSNNSSGSYINVQSVGQKKPNSWGIYDMHGNVEEWCRDLYGDYSANDVTNPANANGGDFRVVRGGSWFDVIENCRSASRVGYSPYSYYTYIGFRLALVNDENIFERDNNVKSEKIVILNDKTRPNIIQNIFNNILNNMIKCPDGSFLMGSPKNEFGRDEDEKQHKVTISKPFYIGKYEVTQKEYETIMGKNVFILENYNGDFPVRFVNWYNAKDFCNKLNEIFSSALPKYYKFDLPTEAQWEYACRAGTNTALNNGKNLTSINGVCSNLNEVACYNKEEDEYEEFLPVGQKKPNVWGIYDMHGNASEWCRDFYGNYPTYTVIDPICNSGSERVIRGGGGYTFAKYCRSASRSGCNPSYITSNTGFRLALVPDESYNLSETDKNSNSLSQEKTEETGVFSQNEIKKQTSSDEFQINTNTIETPKTTNETFMSDKNNSYKSDGYNLKSTEFATSQSSNNYTYNISNNKTIGVITAKSGVNARKEPNTKSQKVGSFAYNKEVTILDTNGPKQTIENITSNWYKVTDGEVTGWCFGGFVSIINK